MKNIQNRRDFIRNTGLTAAAATLPGKLLSSAFAPFYADHFDPGGAFSLLKLEAMFPDYKYPQADRHSTDEFDLKFTLYNTYGKNVRHAGTFSFKKQGGSKPVYDVRSVRMVSADHPPAQRKFDYYFTGRIVTQDDALATPLSWECETKVARGEDEPPYLNSGHQWKGTYKNAVVKYSSGDVHLEKPVSHENLSWKWGLINLVQKMDPEKEIHFSALDEMDMIYEHQYARFRKYQEIETGSGTVKFKVIDVLGDGLIPTVYWVDELDRVVFVINGMEAFVLT
jgi:hypothetical protein